MADFGTILQGLGALAASNPVTVLINRIADSRDARLKPQRMLLEAQTERAIKHDNAIAEVETELALKQLRERAEERVLSEALRDQRNIEAPLAHAIPNIREDAKPEDIDEDWLANFTDKCRLISNEEMQKLWGQILAGEANKPGAFSTRTVNFLATLTQKEALNFRLLCSYNWSLGYSYPVPLIFDDEDPLPISYQELHHLNDIGLIELEPSRKGYAFREEKLSFHYGKSIIDVEWGTLGGDMLATTTRRPNIRIGVVKLTQIGNELASICQPELDDCVIDYVCKRWYSDNLVLSCPLPIPKPPELAKPAKV
jgi:hypothetical protein